MEGGLIVVRSQAAYTYLAPDPCWRWFTFVYPVAEKEYVYAQTNAGHPLVDHGTGAGGMWTDDACGAHSSTRSPHSSASAPTAAPAPTPAPTGEKLRLIIGTGGTGGVFFPYGGGLARILTEKMPNTEATAQETGGSVDNMKLLQSGEAQIRFYNGRLSI